MIKKTFVYVRSCLLLSILLAASEASAALGDLDTSFGTGGSAIIHFLYGAGELAYGVGVQKDGKIILGGESNYADVMARFNGDGTLDPTFGVTGKVFQSTGNFFSDVVKVTSDDKIIMAGGYSGNNSKGVFSMHLYDRTGILDRSFGTNGTAATPIPLDYAFVTDIAIQNDGKIVTAGYALNGFTPEEGTRRYFATARFWPNGSLDETFANR